MRLKTADGITFLSLLSAIFAFTYVLRGQLLLAGIALLISAILDFFDGKVARMMGQASDFGMYLDSLADVVAFGAIPAMIALVLFSAHPMIVIAALMYLCAGVYRLARFQDTKIKGAFQGMPITVNGILFGALLMLSPHFYAFVAYFIIAALAMVSTVRVKKL
jgi:CDP-diacylglycerol---serine O-phosphatidyltransferase